MAKAVWKDAVLAESEHTEVVEGNIYFPPDSLHREYFRESPHTSVCGWKGTARYYDLVVDGDLHEQAAWYYPDAKPEAKSIEGYVAFWKGVEVSA